MSAASRKKRPCKTFGAAHRPVDVPWEAVPAADRKPGGIVRQRCSGCGKVTDWISKAARAAREATA